MPLTLNDDGTVTIDLRVPPGEPGRTIILPEPSMFQLARLHTIVHEADGKLPTLTPIADAKTATTEELELATKQLTERTLTTYGEESPYGNALLDIIRLLLPDATPVTIEDLPGWCSNPSTCRQILSHFQTPLVG